MPLKSTEGAACFLFCSAIQSTYVSNRKRQILDVIYLDSSREFNQSVNGKILFHEFVVDEILSISFYVQTVDGTVVEFENGRPPFVVHCLIKDD